MSILAQLRLSPRATCEAYGIRTEPAGGSFVGVQEGGLCQIACQETGTSVYTLTATAGGGTDYFFPWLQRDYTWVKVPKTVADQTIVMTGGVNGCSIIVSEQGNYYYFYHDGDSKYLPIGSPKIVGNELVRITPADYDPGGFVQQVFTGYLQSFRKAKMQISGDVSYGNYVIFVRSGGQFVACATAVVSVGRPMALKGSYLLSF